MKKLLTKIMDSWRNTDVPNDKLAELILAYISTNGWYLNMNTCDGSQEEKENLIKYAEGEWK